MASVRSSGSHAPRVTAVALVLGLLFVSVLPPAEAAFRTYGTLVGDNTTDKDFSGMLLLELAGASLAFNDAEGDGVYDCTTGEPDAIYLLIDGAGPVAVGDIRLSKMGSLSAGVTVKSADSDRDDDVVAFGGDFTFFDEFPAAGVDVLFNLGEALYLQDDTTDLSTGDVRIIKDSSAETTGGTVSFACLTTSDTTEAARDTDVLAGYDFGAIDMNGNGGYDSNDAVVLDTNDNEMADPGDVFLSKAGSITGGSFAKVGSQFTMHALLDATSDPAFLPDFAWNDIASAGTVDDEEIIYISVGGDTTLDAFDIRLGPVASGASTSSNAGAQVLAADTVDDPGDTLITGGGSLAYRDNNNNDHYDTCDDLYLDLFGSDALEGDIGDLRLAKGQGTGCTSTTGTVGSRIKDGNNDEEATLLDLATTDSDTLKFLDYNGGGEWGRYDVIYVDVDDNGVVSPRDVRISKGTGSVTTFGEPIDDTNTEAEMCFGDTAIASFDLSAALIDWIDEDASGAPPGVEDPLYLDRNGDNDLDLFDVRLTGGSSGAAGTFVQSGNSDAGDGLSTASLALSAFRFHDSGTNGFSSGSGTTGSTSPDDVYIDVTNGAGEDVAVGDARISATSGGSAGTKVKSGASDINDDLDTLPAGYLLYALDVNGNARLDNSDAIYINVDETTEDTIYGANVLHCGSAGDVRLSGTGGGTTSGGSGGSGTTPDVAPRATISTPDAGDCFDLGDAVAISGTATGGSTAGTSNTVSSVALTADGSALTVTGTTSWSASVTPTAIGSVDLLATVTSSSGATDTDLISIAIDDPCETTTPPPANTTQQQLAQLLSQNEAIASQLNQTLANNQQLQQQLTSLNTQLTNQSAQVGALNTRIQQLQQDNARLQAELAGRGNVTGQNGAPGFEVAALLAALGVAVALRRRV